MRQLSWARRVVFRISSRGVFQRSSTFVNIHQRNALCRCIEEPSLCSIPGLRSTSRIEWLFASKSNSVLPAQAYTNRYEGVSSHPKMDPASSVSGSYFMGHGPRQGFISWICESCRAGRNELMEDWTGREGFTPCSHFPERLEG